MAKKNVRALCLLLVVLMCVPLMFACNNNTTTPVDTSNNGSVDTVDPAEEFEVPDNLNFQGETFSILTAGHVAYNDFDMEGQDQESVLVQAQYNRVQTIETKYNCDIELEIKESKVNTNSGPGYQSISAAVGSNEPTYQLGIIGGYDVANLASNNYLYDLNAIEYVNTSKNWWDQNANNDLTINGMLFFTNGSLTVAYSESTFVIYMNSQMVQSHLDGVEAIYQLARDGKWTVDKLSEFSKKVTEDFDGDGVMGKDDVYGLYVWKDSILGMLAAAGVKCATVESDGNIALTLNSENAINMFNKYSEIAFNTASAFCYSGIISGADVYNRFKEGKALFWATSNVNTKQIRDMDADFGILPYPKLTEEQDRYYSTIAPYNSQFICIPSYPGDTEFVGAITEALAYYGYKNVWPACYEQTLQGMWSRDEGTYDMLDIIYSSYVYDIGYYYQVGSYQSGLMKLVTDKSNAFSSTYEASRAAAEGELAIINAYFDQVLASWEEIRNDINK